MQIIGSYLNSTGLFIIGTYAKGLEEVEVPTLVVGN